MPRSIPFYSALALALTISVQSNTASAQKQHAQDIHEQFEENHQQEIQEWYQRWMNPANEPNIEEARAKGLKQFLEMDNSPVVKAASSSAWVQVGCSQAGNVSGRATCISFDPHNAKIIYLGTSQGGLWRTNDAGLNWTSLSDKWPTLAMGAVAVDPKNSNIVYAATGDPYGVTAQGVYKSVDSGLNWTTLTTTPSGAASQMLVNPDNTDYVYLSTNTGLYMSQNAGVDWTKVVSINGVTTFVVDPNNSNIMYASGANVIKKSYDYGKTWISLSGFSAGSLMTMAISKQNSAVVYLSTGSGATSILSRSLDSGVTWTTMNSTVRYLGDQGWYANAIAVNPLKSDDVIVGGLDIYRSTNGGKTLVKKTDWTTNPSLSNFTHADVHILTYNANTLYTLTDGGIYYSNSLGEAWKQDMNKTLATFQFVGGDADPSVSFFAAGAQDNGIGRVDAGQTFFRSIMGGDGGTTFVGQDNGLTLYGTYLGAVLYRSDDGGISFQPGLSGYDLLTNCAIKGEEPGGYMEYDVCESNAAVVALCGRSNVYLTTDGGGTGSSSDFNAITVSGQISGGPRCVHVAKADPNFIYIGGGSALYYSSDGGATFHKSVSKFGTPSSITTDINDPTHVYMTVAGTNSNHFFVSTDTGRTWTHPATTTIPALNYKRIAVAPDGQIFIGHDYGVIRSQDGGQTWAPILEGMPSVSITALHVRGNHGQFLIATTYGRGMYMLDLTQLPPVPKSGVAPTVNVEPAAGSPSITGVYPNPVIASNGHATINYHLAQSGQATIAVYDVLGRQQRVTMNEYAGAGDHIQAVELNNLESGHYFIVLTSNGRTVTQPLNIQ